MWLVRLQNEDIDVLLFLNVTLVKSFKWFCQFKCLFVYGTSLRNWTIGKIASSLDLEPFIFSTEKHDKRAI